MALDPKALSPDATVFAAERVLATLTTLRPDGSPHVAPVGFTWDEKEQLVRIITFASSKKVRNLRTCPHPRAV
ncbi:MAG TPA: pyridoxamine 5'-phosphate oxidase family protein, partial [Acidimicrobiales bacterium]